MPLYVADEDIFALFTNVGVVYGLLSVKATVSERAVTPALALRLIRCYLQPLASAVGRAVFDKKRDASWDCINFLYVELGFLCEHDDDLWQVACAIELVHTHTKRSPRDVEFAPIEVSTFLQHCGYLHLRMEEIRHPKGYQDVDPLRFCELCWRQPLPGRKLCGYHAPSDSMLSEADSRKAVARYKAGMRQKELFGKTVNRILTRETIRFHESNFQDQLLFPDHGIASWLAERRPAIWRELGCARSGLTDENAVQMLLGLLHSPEGLPVKAQALYRIVNAHIQSHPGLIWPMLVRAEGWYQSRELMEKNRGGRRPGAGRPKANK